MMERFTGGTDRPREGDRTGAGRTHGHAEEIAAAVLWLCSDAAAFVVGPHSVLDGGQTT